MRFVLLLIQVLCCAWLGAQESVSASILALPIRINLDPVMRSMEQRVPHIPPGVETWMMLPGSSMKVYRFNLYRDALIFRLHGNRIVVRTAAHYWMEVGLRAGSIVKSLGACGLGPEGHRQAWLGAQAEFGITPQWGVELKAQALEPMAFNACTITVLDFDITNQVLAGMKEAVGHGLEDMAQQVRSSTLLRKKAEEIWTLVQQPLEVSPGVFLVLNPKQVSLGPWKSEGRSLMLNPEIQMQPYLQLGDRPVVTACPLPDLCAISTPLPPGFNIQVEADLPFPEATAQLRRQVAGKMFETDNGRFEIQDIQVRGQGNQAILDVFLKGRVNGRLLLAGTPVINAQSGALELQNLDYTLESRSWITQFGEWLFRSSLRKTLAGKTNWLLQKNLQDLKEQVQAGINRELAPGVALSGQVDDLHVNQPLVLPDRFKVTAFLVGQAGVTLTPLGF